MKIFKFAISTFAVAFMITFVGVKAEGYTTFLDITLPSGTDYYEYGEVTKEIDNFQYYHSQETKTDGFPFGTIKVQAKTEGNGYITSALILSSGEEKTWGNVANQFAGRYKLRLTRDNWSLFSASHWGHWLLDGRLAGTLK